MDIRDIGLVNGQAQSTDITGNNRIQLRDLDLGAYEFKGCTIEPEAVCQGIDVVLYKNGEIIVMASELDGGSSGYQLLTFLINGQSSLTLDCDDIGLNNTWTLLVM